MGNEGTYRAAPIWHRLLIIGPLLIAAGMAFFMVLAGEVIPILVVFAAIFIVAAVLAWRFRQRTGAIVVMVLSLLLVVGNLPFIIEDLAHPESAFGFVPTVFILAAVVLGVVAGIAVLRRWDAGSARWTWVTAATVFVVALVVGLVASLSLEDDVAAAGDLRISADKVEFEPVEISASAGTIGILVDNEDPVRHTFAIDAFDLEQELPASTARRVQFTASPGTYEYYCSVPGHEDMKGTLTVSG